MDKASKLSLHLYPCSNIYKFYNQIIVINFIITFKFVVIITLFILIINFIIVNTPENSKITVFLETLSLIILTSLDRNAEAFAVNDNNDNDNNDNHYFILTLVIKLLL